KGWYQGYVAPVLNQIIGGLAEGAALGGPQGSTRTQVSLPPDVAAEERAGAAKLLGVPQTATQAAILPATMVAGPYGTGPRMAAGAAAAMGGALSEGQDPLGLDVLWSTAMLPLAELLGWAGPATARVGPGAKTRIANQDAQAMLDTVKELAPGL